MVDESPTDVTPPVSSTRRDFNKKAAAAATAPAIFHIVPSHVLGGPDAPSNTFGGALIGCGGRGFGTWGGVKKGLNARLLAVCDVDQRRADNAKRRGDRECKAYDDFRRVLERPDIDVVAIATPPHWHALISIAAMEAGKDVLCEKPMTRTIAEGRAVVETAKRYKRVFQIGTFGRFGKSRNRRSIDTHKIMRSGLLNPNPGVFVKRGGLKAKQWSGKPALKPQPVPEHLDWDLYCGPSPLKPFVRERHGGTHRNYWDYEGGGLADMSQHTLDPFQWEYGKDDTSPVSIEAFAPPAHPECTGMWSWVELVYADGFTLVLESGEWGPPYERKKSRGVSLNDLTKEQQAKVQATPDPNPLLSFGEAVKTRGQAGGHAEASHRAATLLHLANIAIRTGRKLTYDPVKEQVVGDEQANRLVSQPMRAPWHL